MDSVKALVSEKTCAIIMETLRGKAEFIRQRRSFIKGVRKICDENDILLILDEIQCGMGRTGTMLLFTNNME